MKILVITTDFPPNVSGIATLSYEEAAGLPGLGHDVRVATTFPGARTAAGGELSVAEFECGGGGLKAMTCRYQCLKKVIREYEPEFLWCTNYRGFGLPTLWAARKFGIPYGIYYHGTEVVTETKSLVRRKLFSMVADGARVRACNSRNTVRLLLDRHGIEAQAVTPGVRTQLGRADETGVRRLREEWTARCGGKEAVVLLTAGRLSREKGIDVVIRAMQMAPNDLRSRLVYVVAGSGPEREAFEQLAGHVGLQNQVVFLGPLDSEALFPVYQAADFYIQPSQPVGDFLESFGISFLEAQSQGLPCLGTNWGGIPESVKAGETGILVETGSVEAVLGGIEQLVSSEYWNTTARERAVSWAKENGWNQHVERLNASITASREV